MACTAYPTVLNGKIVDNGTEFAEYECLSGFYMTGNKRITCNPNTGVWDDKPTCSVIDNSDKVTVYPDWWLFALIAILGLLVLLCLICIICYFCCGRGGNAVHPYQDHGDDGCCTCCGRSRKRDAHAYDVNGYNTVRTPSSGRDGIYFIPVKSSQTQYDDGDLYGTHKHPHTVQPSKPAKEVKAWMPHSKPLRTDHNTSTK